MTPITFEKAKEQVQAKGCAFVTQSAQSWRFDHLGLGFNPSDNLDDWSAVQNIGHSRPEDMQLENLAKALDRNSSGGTQTTNMGHQILKSMEAVMGELYRPDVTQSFCMSMRKCQEMQTLHLDNRT